MITLAAVLVLRDVSCASVASQKACMRSKYGAGVFLHIFVGILGVVLELRLVSHLVAYALE